MSKPGVSASAFEKLVTQKNDTICQARIADGILCEPEELSSKTHVARSKAGSPVSLDASRVECGIHRMANTSVKKGIKVAERDVVGTQSG